MVYYREIIRIRISQRKRLRGQNWGGVQMRSYWLPSPYEVNAHSVRCPVLLGLILPAGLIFSLHSFWLRLIPLVSSVALSFHHIHIVRLFGGQSPGKQRYSHQAGHSRG